MSYQKTPKQSNSRPKQIVAPISHPASLVALLIDLLLAITSLLQWWDLYALCSIHRRLYDLIGTYPAELRPSDSPDTSRASCWCLIDEEITKMKELSWCKENAPLFCNTEEKFVRRAISRAFIKSRSLASRGRRRDWPNVPIGRARFLKRMDFIEYRIRRRMSICAASVGSPWNYMCLNKGETRATTFVVRVAWESIC